ncbi:MAG: hypothetical protein K6F30_04655 [Lachnospiraceae bacterium]|nr:hypothetical protein [Lachnospiraceae bacterium]
MARTIKEKLDEEYELFYLKMVGSSKANLFAKSQEIEMKKRIYCYLRQELENSTDEKLMLLDSIIDEVYRKAMDSCLDCKEDAYAAEAFESIARGLRGCP